MRAYDIPWRLASARAKDIEKIPHAVMKSLRTPGELALRLVAYDALVSKGARPGLEPGLARGYRDLARRVLVSDDQAEVGSLMKTAGVVGSYGPAELQQLLRARQAFKLADGHIVAAADARDVRYAVTLAQGAIGQGTAEDSASFRGFLVRRCQVLGCPDLIPAGWGRPSAPAVSPSTTRQNSPLPGNTAGKSTRAASGAPGGRRIVVTTDGRGGAATVVEYSR